MKITHKHRKEHYRTIYEQLNQRARIQLNNLSTVLGVNRNVASKRLKESFDLGYVLIPQIRKRSYANMNEYIYLVECKDALDSYLRYIQDMNVAYHAVMTGFANLWVFSKEQIELKGDVIVEGLRSDFHVAYAPNHSWREAIQIMQKKIENFNPEDYKSVNIIKNHWEEHARWSLEDEILFREFKYNMRKKLGPIMRKRRISGGKIYQFFDRLPECCTVFTRYFPETISAYDPYLFMFETDYEDFIIDLFSELPTSSFYSKVSDKLLVYANMAKELMRCTELYVTINKLQVPLLIKSLLEMGILKSEAHAIVEYYYGKDL